MVFHGTSTDFKVWDSSNLSLYVLPKQNIGLLPKKESMSTASRLLSA